MSLLDIFVLSQVRLILFYQRVPPRVSVSPVKDKPEQTVPPLQSRRRVLRPTPAPRATDAPDPFAPRRPPDPNYANPFFRPTSRPPPFGGAMSPQHPPNPFYPGPGFQGPIQPPLGSFQSPMTGPYAPHYHNPSGYRAQPTEETAPKQNVGANSAPHGKMQNPEKKTFQRPNILVLPQADAADIGDSSPLLKLDVRFDGTKICRQVDPPVWNSNQVADTYGMNGKAVMASLIGDKTARYSLGTDLYLTLTNGKDMKIAYARGNSKYLLVLHQSRSSSPSLW